MTPFQKEASNKILKCYQEPSLQKGRGKTAFIGEVRKFGDGIEYVKTTNDWKPIKTHSHLIDHTLEQNAHLKKPVQETSEIKQTPVIEQEKKTSSTTEQRLKGGLQLYGTGYPVIDTVLEEITPLVEKIIESHKKWAQKENLPFTQRDQEYVELAVVSDLVGALGRYIKKTDSIQNMDFHTDTGGSIVIRAQILRDGTPHYFSTQVIYAGGYNIQRLHLRYIVDTKLPSHFNQPLSILEQKIKKMKAEDKAKLNIAENDKVIERYREELSKLESKTKESVTEEKKEWYRSNKFPLTWDEVNPQSYIYEKGKAAFDADKELEFDRAWERVKSDIKWKKSSLKELEKKKLKLEQKLEEIIKEGQKEVSIPQEGDYKVSREKQHFPGQNHIHISVFKDGNFKHTRSTSFKKIRDAGFNPTTDQGVIDYHKYRLQESKNQQNS